MVESIKVKEIAMMCQNGHRFHSPGRMFIPTGSSRYFEPKITVCPKCGVFATVKGQQTLKENNK